MVPKHSGFKDMECLHLTVNLGIVRLFSAIIVSKPLKLFVLQCAADYLFYDASSAVTSGSGGQAVG